MFPWRVQRGVLVLAGKEAAEGGKAEGEESIPSEFLMEVLVPIGSWWAISVSRSLSVWDIVAYSLCLFVYLSIFFFSPQVLFLTFFLHVSPSFSSIYCPLSLFLNTLYLFFF